MKSLSQHENLISVWIVSMKTFRQDKPPVGSYNYVATAVKCFDSKKYDSKVMKTKVYSPCKHADINIT